MEDGNLEQKLQTVFNTVFVEQVRLTPELSAKDVGEWDSMAHILLVVEVERAFGIKFNVGEVDSVNNVGEFLGLIAKKLSQNPQGRLI